MKGSNGKTLELLRCARERSFDTSGTKKRSKFRALSMASSGISRSFELEDNSRCGDRGAVYQLRHRRDLKTDGSMKYAYIRKHGEQ